MANERDKWLDIKVKAHVPGAQINRLDEHLNQSLPALVIQQLESGKFAYKPDDQGEYIVRCHVPMMLGMAKAIIEHNAFEVVSAKEMPEGKDVKV